MDSFCPKLEPISEQIEDLEYTDRLDIINKEALSLYAFCLKKGFSNNEIKNCIAGLHGPPDPSLVRKTVKDSSRSLLSLSILIGALAIIYASPSFSNYVIVHARIVTIKFVLPYWNWASYYNEECIIGNPYLPNNTKPVDSESCLYCSNVVDLGNNQIDRLNNITTSEFNIHYISQYQPAVVTDTMSDWQNKKMLNMQEIIQLYIHHPTISQALGTCYYTTNAKNNGTFYDFFNDYVENILPDEWYANWINCDVKAAKVLRHYYSRPYFLPDMVQAGKENGVIVAKGFKDEWFPFRASDNQASATWLTVIEGSIRVKLSPMNDCKQFNCKDTEVQLGKGETVFYAERGLWAIEYATMTDDLTIVIASPVIWDEPKQEL